MRAGRRRAGRAGFTLVEMLVTIVLVSLALVGIFGGMGAASRTEAKARDADLLQRLALQKMNEVGVVLDPRTSETSGDFADQGHPDVEWTIETESTQTLNVEQVTVTARRGDAAQALTGLVYLRPLSTGAPSGAGG